MIKRYVIYTLGTILCTEEIFTRLDTDVSRKKELQNLVDEDQIDRYISSYHCVTAKKLFSEL